MIFFQLKQGYIKIKIDYHCELIHYKNSQMLELRPVCENCNKSLPNDSTEARICTFECTFCKDCVENILHNVCPNCGGGFEKRPSRPKALLEKYPMKSEPLHKPVDLEKFEELLMNNKVVPPNER